MKETKARNKRKLLKILLWITLAVLLILVVSVASFYLKAHSELKGYQDYLDKEQEKKQSSERQDGVAMSYLTAIAAKAQTYYDHNSLYGPKNSSGKCEGGVFNDYWIQSALEDQEIGRGTGVCYIGEGGQTYSITITPSSGNTLCIDTRGKPLSTRDSDHDGRCDT